MGQKEINSSGVKRTLRVLDYFGIRNGRVGTIKFSFFLSLI